MISNKSVDNCGPKQRQMLHPKRTLNNLIEDHPCLTFGASAIPYAVLGEATRRPVDEPAGTGIETTRSLKSIT